MRIEMTLEKSFWRYWLGGLLLLAFMAALNPYLANAVAPWAILDHQTAGSAARVDAIQFAWARDGVLNLARFSMAIDLLFIPAYSRKMAILPTPMLSGPRKWPKSSSARQR
jgi:hypothetical protein